MIIKVVVQSKMEIIILLTLKFFQNVVPLVNTQRKIIYVEECSIKILLGQQETTIY